MGTMTLGGSGLCALHSKGIISSVYDDIGWVGGTVTGLREPQRLLLLLLLLLVL